MAVSAVYSPDKRVCVLGRRLSVWGQLWQTRGDSMCRFRVWHGHLWQMTLMSSQHTGDRKQIDIRRVTSSTDRQTNRQTDRQTDRTRQTKSIWRHALAGGIEKTNKRSILHPSIHSFICISIGRPTFWPRLSTERYSAEPELLSTEWSWPAAIPRHPEIINISFTTDLYCIGSQSNDVTKMTFLKLWFFQLFRATYLKKCTRKIKMAL